MVLKVFGLPFSTCTARVLACLEEIGLEHELIPVDLPAGEHKRAPHIERNVSIFFYLSLRISLINPSFQIYSNPSARYFGEMFFLIVLSCVQPFGKIPALQDEDLVLFGEEFLF